MIELNNIRKSFRVSRRSGGLKNAAAALFRRDYDTINALDGISFQVNDGEMVGYIGPNGAGKSSTIKVMSGILTPDSGECLINNRIPWHERTAHVREIGVVFGQRSQLWWDVPVADSFELLRDIYVIPEQQYRKTLDHLVQLLDIGTIMRTPARMLSLGQRMRCEIVASLLHLPKILFLDEPTIGLDAVSKIAVREFVRERNREYGTTVILTTHDMQDIEAITERIMLIGRGKILLDGSLAELRRRYAYGRELTVEYSREQDIPTTLAHGITQRERSFGRVVYSVDTAVISIGAAISSLTDGREIRDISVGEPSLDDIVLRLYNEFLGEVSL